MLKYALVLTALILSEILAAMGYVQYVDVFYSTSEAYAVGYAVGPLTILIMGFTVAMLNPWHDRLVVDAMIAQRTSYGSMR